MFLKTISDENTRPGPCVSPQIRPVEATMVVEARTAKSVWLIFVAQTLTRSEGITSIVLVNRLAPLCIIFVRTRAHCDDNGGINMPRSPSCSDVPPGKCDYSKI
jgi:hypothetical protein